MKFEINWARARSIKFNGKLLSALQREFSRAIPEAKGKNVSISFVSQAKMRELNKSYRGIGRATDVLSFSALEGEKMPSVDHSFVGDIVICPPYVRASAKKQKVPFAEELLRMFVHGAMHCLEFDHATKREEAKMIPLQESIIHNVLKKREV